jgi:uncharacterized protein YegL
MTTVEITTHYMKDTTSDNIPIRESCIQIDFANENTTRESIYFKVLLDTTGSMIGAPLIAAKTALLSFINLLRDDDIIDISQFSTEVTSIFTGPATSANKEQLKTIFESVYTEGCTNIGAALQNIKDTYPDPSTGSSLQRYTWLMTDGYANTGKTDTNDLIQIVRDIPYFTNFYLFGFSRNCNENQLRTIAASSDSEFRYIRNVDNIGLIFGDIYYEIVMPNVRNFTVKSLQFSREMEELSSNEYKFSKWTVNRPLYLSETIVDNTCVHRIYVENVNKLPQISYSTVVPSTNYTTFNSIVMENIVVTRVKDLLTNKGVYLDTIKQCRKIIEKYKRIAAKHCTDVSILTRVKQTELDIDFIEKNLHSVYDINQRLDELNTQNYSTFSSPYVPELRREISEAFQSNINDKLNVPSNSSAQYSHDRPELRRLITSTLSQRQDSYTNKRQFRQLPQPPQPPPRRSMRSPQSPPPPPQQRTRSDQQDE